MQHPSTITYADRRMPVLHRVVIHALEEMTGRRVLTRRYHAFRDETNGIDGPAAWDLAIEKLGIRLDIDLGKAQRRPGKGLLLIANHPFGVVDGIVLSWIASRLDPDFRTISISVLLNEPKFLPNLLPIDFSGSREAARTNLETRRAATATLAQGGVVGIFPAGGVSWSRKRGAPIEDDPWKPMTGKLIRASGCDVLPVRFEGANSLPFQLASRHSQILRYGLFLNEVRNKLDRPMRVTIGDRLNHEDLPPLPPDALTRYLRACLEYPF